MLPENHIRLVLLTGVSRKTALKMQKIGKFEVWGALWASLLTHKIPRNEKWANICKVTPRYSPDDARKPYIISTITLGNQEDHPKFAINADKWQNLGFLVSLPPQKRPKRLNEANFWNIPYNARKPNRISSITMDKKTDLPKNAENLTNLGWIKPWIGQIFSIFRWECLVTQGNGTDSIWFPGFLMDISREFYFRNWLH